MMQKVIERATGIVYTVEVIDGGYKILTEAGELYKKLRESTFKKYFKPYKVETAEFNTAEHKEAAKPEPITEEKRQQMIDKVKKLLNLSENNPSQEEAISAALMAQKLMAKYNIHESDVTLEEIKEDIDSVFTEQKHNSSLHSWRKQLAVVVSKSFRCKCYTRGQDIVFRGYKDDALLAHDVYIMLYTIGDSLGSKAYNQALKETGSGKGIYNSFVAGFIKGVSDAFNKQCTALMVITPKEVEEEWTQFSATFRKTSTHLRVTNARVYDDGYIEGKFAANSRSIESKGGKKS